MKLSHQQIETLIEDGVIIQHQQRIICADDHVGWTALEFRVGDKWFTCMKTPEFDHYFGFCPVEGWSGGIPIYRLKNEIHQEEPIEFLKSYM